jgi:hypothetical protein
MGWRAHDHRPFLIQLSLSRACCVLSFAERTKEIRLAYVCGYRDGLQTAKSWCAAQSDVALDTVVALSTATVAAARRRTKDLAQQHQRHANSEEDVAGVAAASSIASSFTSFSPSVAPSFRDESGVVPGSPHHFHAASAMGSGGSSGVTQLSVAPQQRLCAVAGRMMEDHRGTCMGMSMGAGAGAGVGMGVDVGMSGEVTGSPVKGEASIVAATVSNGGTTGGMAAHAKRPGRGVPTPGCAPVITSGCGPVARSPATVGGGGTSSIRPSNSGGGGGGGSGGRLGSRSRSPGRRGNSRRRLSAPAGGSGEFGELLSHWYPGCKREFVPEVEESDYETCVISDQFKRSKIR